MQLWFGTLKSQLYSPGADPAYRKEIERKGSDRSMNVEWRRQFQKLFQIHLPERSETITAGIHHFRREAGGNVTRFHLRVESDGSGLLLANASVAARLSSAGVLIAKGLLDQKSEEEIKRTIRDSFRSNSESQLNSDIRRLKEFIETLSNPEDNYPVFNLADPDVSGPQTLFAPFHAQLRIASSDRTNLLLEKLWHSGVIHVTFTSLSESSESEAVANVERAEDLGMISGVRGMCPWLQSPGLTDRLALAGVDYLLLPWIDPPDIKSIQSCIDACRKWEICPAVEIPLMKRTVPVLDHALTELMKAGVKNVFYYAITSSHQPDGLEPKQIIEAAVHVEALSQSADVRYMWLPPVSKTGGIPKILEEGPRTAGDVSIRVEPDGSVYPARGPAFVAGNLNTESLNQIWNREVFLKYRKRIESPTRCEICPGLELCSADCPADPRAWASEGNV